MSNPLDDLWAKLNKIASDEERLAFNAWKDDLWAIGDRIRDESLRYSASIGFRADAGHLMRTINGIPLLKGGLGDG